MFDAKELILLIKLSVNWDLICYEINYNTNNIDLILGWMHGSTWCFILMYTLHIFGNANMDNVIDQTYIEYMRWIIEGTSEITELADADQDGSVDEQDVSRYENQARVHFIPNLKVGVFVNLRAPDVINHPQIRVGLESASLVYSRTRCLL